MCIIGGIGRLSADYQSTVGRQVNQQSTDYQLLTIEIYHKQEVVPWSFLTPIKLSKPPPSRPMTHPKCLVFNARSLAKPYAVEGLREELKTNAVDVCFVSDTWLSECIPNHLVTPDGLPYFARTEQKGKVEGFVFFVESGKWSAWNYHLMRMNVYG